jgi:hypothetical protein
LRRQLTIFTRGWQEKSPVTIQQHHICFVIGLLMCNSTLRRPFPSICGSSEAALLNSYSSDVSACF